MYVKSKSRVIRSLNVTFDESGLIIKPLPLEEEEEDDFTGRANKIDPALRPEFRGEEVSDAEEFSDLDLDNDEDIEVLEVLETRFLIEE